VIRLIARRIAVSIPLLFIVSALTFVLEWLAPGNAAETILGANGTPAQYAALTKELGLNHPISQQYWDWLSGILHGNLGTSLFSGETVASAIDNRLPVTLWLIVGGVGLSAVLGMSVGMAVAARGGRVGRSLDVLSLLFFSVPSFWLGLLLVELFAVQYRIFPATGYVGLTSSLSQWFLSLVLPVVALGIGGMAVVAKVTRDAMLDVLQRDFVRNLRANGIPAWSIILKHGLKNAAIPVITILGLISVGLLGGTVAIENVFALPGLGSLAVSATTSHDVPVVQGITIYFTLIVVAINLLLDIAYGWLNPRARATS
jgi:peptide/nickel transport system permease protein